jgi:hypothetical protein
MESVPRPLLCNRSVNTFQQYRLFSVCGWYGGCITRFHTEQCSVSECVFKCLSSVEFSVEDSHGKFVCDLKTWSDLKR